MKTFNEQIEELVKVSRPHIAFGLLEKNDEILASLKRGQQYADITLVGKKEAVETIEEFDVVVTENPEEKIAEMLANDEVEGIVRGTIDCFKTYTHYQKLTGEESDLFPSLMQDVKGRQYFLSPASNPEGWEKEERLNIAIGIAEFMKEWNLEANIAIFTGVRHDTYKRKKDIKDGATGILNKTYEDAEWIVDELTKKGYKAKNWVIELNTAVEDGVNVLIPVSGMVGNQIFRAILMCDGKVLAVPRLGLSRCYEENSRTEVDYEPHVKWLTARINKKKNA